MRQEVIAQPSVFGGGKEMKRLSSDYRAMREGRCELCGRRILAGMSVFNVELTKGGKGVAHSACESKIKGKAEKKRRHQKTY